MEVMTVEDVGDHVGNLSSTQLAAQKHDQTVFVGPSMLINLFLFYIFTPVFKFLMTACIVSNATRHLV